MKMLKWPLTALLMAALVAVMVPVFEREASAQALGQRIPFFTALASAQRTATVTTSDLVNPGCRGIAVMIDVTAINATPSVTVQIQVKNPAAANTYFTLASSAALTTVSGARLVLFPGITATANQTISDVLTGDVRIAVVHGDADAITYSVCAYWLP